MQLMVVLLLALYGLVALLLGWINFNHIALICMANPLFLGSFYLFSFTKKYDPTLILSILSSILAISFLQIEEIIQNESGTYGEITGYLLGYCLWAMSQFALPIILLVEKRLRQIQNIDREKHEL